MVSSGNDSSDSEGSRRSLYRLPSVLRLPDFRAQEVALKHVKLGYRRVCKNAFTFAILVTVAAICAQLVSMLESGELELLWATAVRTHVQSSLREVFALSVALAFGLAAYLFTRKAPIYLVDFSVLKPPKDWRVCVRENDPSAPNELNNLARARLAKNVGSEKADELLDFMLHRIQKNAGVTYEGTYLPPGITDLSQEPTMENARAEAELVLFTLVEDALHKTGLTPKDIDILVVNCSLFGPTPSLASMLVNHFKMRSDIQSYNLGGMGCSAGLISINLAKDLLQVRRNSTALVVSTENITQNFYLGMQKSMIIPNVLFRVGGAAVVLSNKRKDGWRAKYQLQHLVRTHRGADDAAYECVYQKEDPSGTVGVKLDKKLMAVAGEALKVNITTLGPLVLPLHEQLKFFLNLVSRKFLKMKKKAYIPDFKTAFDHFCIHAGGRGVIDALQDNLKLTERLVRPSRQTLYHYGNTSSSSVWYELAWMETQRGMVQYGDRIWQISFGSGFKCNSAVWTALRTNDKPHHAWIDP